MHKIQAATEKKEIEFLDRQGSFCQRGVKRHTRYLPCWKDRKCQSAWDIAKFPRAIKRLLKRNYNECLQQL